MPVAAAEGLEIFHPLIASWFEREVGHPTEAQRRAWPLIRAGGNILVTAPTGSGKTLTAFLWALDRLLTGAWESGRVRVLYVSPLKALNNDIERNLLAPLARLETVFCEAGEDYRPVRVATRSGDTPGAERQRMLRHPPEILITTPESLNILLTSVGGRSLFSDVQTVILDEIHAVAGGKRGTHLVTAVERLVPLAGEFQRIALSATIRPLSRIARFVAGHELVYAGEGEPEHRPRPITIVATEEKKRYEIEVIRAEELCEKTAPEVATQQAGSGERQADEHAWTALTKEFRRVIGANRSTLIFANSRRTTEKLTRLLNEGLNRELAYSHHGSLSREIRSVVEERLKQGRLKAIVATNSLELGIDIGSLDEVLLLATPPTVASAVQRIGRSGHGVGEISRARLFPFFERDFLDAAVMARCVLDQDLEEVEPVRAPLDVLAQVIVSMVATESWEIEELFARIRAADPYRDLTRPQFELVLEMLAGRYADSRIRELQPQISLDKIDGTVRGRRGAARRVYFSGGTIPDRGYYQLRVDKTGARLGELDEEFVWERSVGDTFSLGAQAWRVVKITHSDVFVAPAFGSATLAPFWRAEERDRSFHLSERIGRFLEWADGVLSRRGGEQELGRRLGETYRMSAGAASRLVQLLARQRAESGAPLPHRRRLLVERVRDERGESGREHLLLHTFWGGRVNRPFAIALAAAWAERFDAPLEIDSSNDTVILTTPADFEVSELWELVRPDNLDRLLRQQLETTGLFGASFRENAGRALLLPRAGANRRVPLWLQRERSKKLLTSVRRYDDFPIVVETWRSCLRDRFDLAALVQVLGEIDSGEIGVVETRTGSGSPFAAEMVWKQTNRLMYEDDVPESGGDASVRKELLREVAFSAQLRPELPTDLVVEFEQKLQRLAPGYSPTSGQDLIEWVKERVVIPKPEWRELLAAIEADSGDLGSMLAASARRVAALELGGSEAVVAAIEIIPRLLTALGREVEEVVIRAVDGTSEAPVIPSELVAGKPESDPQELLLGLVSEWVRYYGPLSPSLLEHTFGLSRDRAENVVQTLVDDEVLVFDRFGRGTDSPLEVCDAENLERLLRQLRARSRPIFRALPLTELPLFLALHQGLATRADGVEGLEAALDRLFLYPAHAAQWEADYLPARLEPYYPAWLDSLLAETDLRWVGCAKEKTTFLFPGDLELLADGENIETPTDRPGARLRELFPAARGSFSLDELAEASGLSADTLEPMLWQGVWSRTVSNTSYVPLRRAIASRFKTAALAPRATVRHGRRPAISRRGRFERWRAGRPAAGRWYLLASVEGSETAEEGDALVLEERNRERARLVLDRYGVVFRELLAKELPGFGWRSLFRSLRLMELSGEVLSGHFFEGVPGPQFASRPAFKRLSEGLERGGVFWMSATDPASPAGLGLDGLRGTLPPRLGSTHFVFDGSKLVVVSRRLGNALEIRAAPDHPRIDEYLSFLKVLLGRQFEPLKAIDIESINDESARTSPYAPTLRRLFDVTTERQTLRLRRRY